MKLPVFMLLMLFAGTAQADAKTDAFNAGASYGKGSASQGTSTLKNPSDVTSAIPGYTSNPPEKSYYGGVSGGDGGLSDKGQAALGNSAAGQAVVDSSTKNPMPVIDPKAPFITIGKNAEAGAESVMDGTSQQCVPTTVSKSTFENFTCSADVAVQKTCQRDTQINGYYENRTTTKTINVTKEQFIYSRPDSTQIDWAFPLPAGAQMLSGTLTFWQCKSCSNNTSSLNYPGGGVKLDPNDDISVEMGVAGQTVPADGFLRGNWRNKYSDGYLESLWSRLADTDSFFYGQMYMKATVTIISFEQVWVPSTSTPSVCPDNTGGKLVNSVCTVGGGNRETVVDGVTRTVYSACWQYTDTYLVSENTQGTCSSLASNPACTKSGETCTEYTNGLCSHSDYVYQCQTVHGSQGLVCGGEYICQSGECDATNGAGDNGFDTAVAKLAGLASAAQDVSNEQNQMNVRAFTGQPMSCRKAFAGFNNCCKDAGWGADAGLAACNSDEMAIGKAKAKKVTVSVGERCDRQVLGVCVQKSQVYCVFTGKLARIIQEQGRRDQLHVGFGSGNSPDCRGITVPELQGINFDLVNFSDFYEDLMSNQKIPDTATMTKLAKDRVAAQVNQMGGSK